MCVLRNFKIRREKIADQVSLLPKITGDDPSQAYWQCLYYYVVDALPYSD